MSSAMQSAQNFKDLKFVGNFGGKEIDASFVFLKPLGCNLSTKFSSMVY